MLHFVKSNTGKQQMSDKYRVICSENQQLYPQKIFVDIYPAGNLRPENSLTHDGLLQMRRLINPNVEKLESGIILTDFGHGNIILQYEKTYNRRMQQYQDFLRQRLDPLIIQTFLSMKQHGKDRTIEVSLSNMAVMYDLHKLSEDHHLSAREEALIKQNEQIKKTAEKRRQLIHHHAQNKYASNPHLLLAWRQAKHNGD